MKKYLTVAVLLVIILSSSLANAEETSQQYNYLFRAGLGFGIPYGGIGFNGELSPIDYIALTGGFGYTPGGPGWSVGVRIYPLSQDYRFRPRLSAYHGVVALLEEEDWFGNDDYETEEGNAFGAGIDIRIGSSSSLDFEVLAIDYDPPKGYERKGSDIVISLGWGMRF